MPTFHIYKSSTKIDEIVGANINSIDTKLAYYSANSNVTSFPGKGRKLDGSLIDPNESNRSNYYIYIIGLIILIWLYFNRNNTDIDDDDETSLFN